MSRFVVASKPETKTKPSSARRTPERTPRATAVVAPRRLPDAPESAEPLQAKLTIGEVDDPLEREADHVADHVMRMPSSASPSGESNPTGDGSGVNVRSGVIQRECSTCAEESASEESLETEDALDDETSLSSSAVLQRACSSCSEESSDEERLQRDSAPTTGARKMSSTPSGRFARELEAARSTGGRALPRAVRAFMEPRFGLDLSHVRVHTDARAGELNRHVSARAFTVGHDIFFRPSEFNPDTHAGRRLIAHELTHTVQQRRGLGSVQREILQREVIQREEAPGGVAARAGSDVQGPVGAPDADLVQPGNPPAPFAVPTPETAGVEIAPTEALDEPDLTEPTDEGAFEEQLESQAPQDTTGIESLESGFASIEAAPPAEELVEEEDEPAATMSEDPGVLRRNEAITKLRDQISARNLELEEVAASTRAGIHDAAVAQRERVASTLSAERDALSAATEAQLEQLAATARAARDSIVTARDSKIEEVLQAADAESEKLETLIQAKITKLMEVARGKAKEARALGEAQAVRVEKASRANADSAIVTGTRVINAFSGADQPGRIQSEVRKESSRVAARLLEHGVGLAGQARSRAEAIAQVILDDAVQTGETFETEVRPRALTRIEQERNQATERIRRMADEPLNQLSALEASLGERLKATESSFANILSQLAGATSADIGTAEIRANARLDVDLERALAELSAFAVEGEGLLSTASPELATERLSELSGAVDEGVAGYLTSLNRYGVAVEEQMTARADQVVARSTARTNGNSALGGVGAALETKLAELATNVARDIDEVASGGVQQMAEVTRSAGTDLDSAIDQKDTVWAGDLIRDTAKIREDVDTELAKQDATVRGLEPTLRQLAQEIADESLLERVAKFVGGVLVGALVAGLILLAVGAAIALITPALVALVGALVAVVIAGGPLAVLAAVALVVLAGAAVYLIVTGIIDGWRKVSEEAWRDDLSSFEGGMKFGEGIVDIVGSVLGLSALRTILRRGLQRGAAKAAARRRPGALEGPAESGKPPRTLTAPETKADLVEAESAATRSRAEAEAAAKAATELEQVTLETLFRKGLTDDAAAEVFLSQLARELSPPAQRELQRLVGSKLRPSQALQLLERAGVENPKQFFEDLAKVRDPADPSIQEGAAAELPKTPVLEQDIDVIVKQRPTSWDVSLTIKARDPTRGNIEVEPTWALASAPLKGGKPTKGPSLGIFTKEALPGGTQKVKLDPEKRFSFTKKALQLVREQFRKDFGHDPETLPGSLADDNLANFRTEWIKIKLADPNISDSKAGEMAIRRISFGRARIAEGYSEFELPPQPLEMVEVRVGGKSRQIEVPKNVEVIARRPAQSGIELNTTDTE